ncbi:unnamed protein product [Rhizophagus irregularis]|nr:unnamed protein product [Rhizophagus irregularis]
MKVALKRLNGSLNMSADFLNELKTHWKLNCLQENSLKFYGISKDPETEEIIMVMQCADNGNLRNTLSINFNNILWKEKLGYLYASAMDLSNLHKLGYFHKDFHSGNILNIGSSSYISDFGLSRPSNEQKSSDSNKIVGVLPYIAPEILNGEPYTLSSDIYSFGVIMAELSSGKPPFYKRNHDGGLALEICNGLRPEFGKGTPEIYKKLAHKCMNANPNQRPTANELDEILDCWHFCSDNEKYGYKGEEVRAVFEEADKEYQIFQPHMKKNLMLFILVGHLHLKICQNLLIHLLLLLHILMKITKAVRDSQLVDLEIPSTSKLEDGDSNN